MIYNNKTLALILFLLISFVCSALGDPPAPSAAPFPPGTPIDSNIAVLIILGVLYGAYKLHQKRKKTD